MPSVFTRIFNRELPARFVHEDDRCGAFLSIAPLRPGHTLVVPKVEIDHWLDLEPDLVAHLMRVAQTIGRAQMLAFAPTRIGLMIAGLEVPHVHVHVVPIEGVHDLDFANANHNASAASLDEAAQKLREALAQLETAACS
ncbi:MAG TPA: HIT family protein [Nannocystis sp.]